MKAEWTECKSGNSGRKRKDESSRQGRKRSPRMSKLLSGGEGGGCLHGLTSAGVYSRSSSSGRCPKGCARLHTASNSASRGYGVSQLGKQCSFDYPEVKCINRRNTGARRGQETVSGPSLSRNLNFHSTMTRGKFSFPYGRAFGRKRGRASCSGD